MSTPDTILQLVENFEFHRQAYLSQDYNEAQVRREFVDPFFEALGWDMFNKGNYASAYKDVIHEDAIHMGGATKAPDYAFRIGGTRKFFVEAKKPAVNLRDAISPAYQLRRYAWSAKLPLSILTDFEEFTVYDCRLKPTLSDKSSTARIQLLTYRDYPTHWDEIASVFSREAVLKGSFDQYAESATGKHGTAEVDHAFLAEIERWRDLLAHNIALRNPSLSQRDLNFAIQMTIDRIIFLRICEDRGIEFYGQLQALLNGGDVYPRLCQLFRNADDRYNSGLFHFRAEKGQADLPDALSLGLAMDDKPLKDLLANLYYPESPYEFSVLPADILGQVYEQFLGKVIRLTNAHHAVVEDKPEVKKAGGVFYTPTFIVDYIVKHTLGNLLQDRKPGEVGLGRGAPIRVLDMACGSGSFLLGAYQYLLDWYLNAYSTSEPEKWAKGHAPQLVQAGHGEWKLTTFERKRILLDHIYGVDIDPQAVEVTKLSLLLKVLEGENQDTVGKQLSLFHQRALPDLGQNIKCGNSLIGPDFYSDKQSSFISTEEQYRINAFDWQREFAQVFPHTARILWLVTFVTHNSRISERMVTYGVKSGDPLILNAQDRLLIAQYISAACRSHTIPVVAWNVLPDHVHMILAAEDEQELDEHVRKIKGFSSYSFQRAQGWDEGGHVWAQKYHHLLITDQPMLENACSYVMDNHIKHADQWGQELIEAFEVHLTTQPTSPTRGLSPLPSTPPSTPPSDPTRGLSPLLRDVRDKLCVTPEIACQPSSGGFDVIIGNPPYIRIQALKEWAPLEVEFYKKRYISASKGNYDIYVVFVEKGLSLLSPNGHLGFILPHKFFNAQYGQPLRTMLSEGKHLAKVVHFSDQQVFENATTYTCLMFLDKAGQDEFEFEKVDDLQTWHTGTSGVHGEIPASRVTTSEWNFSVGKGEGLFDKLSQMPIKLGDVADRIAQGIRTSANEIYVLDMISESGNTLTAFSKQLNRNVTVERESVYLFLQGREIKRYRILYTGKVVIVPYSSENGRLSFIAKQDMRGKYPKTFAYLSENKTYLENRERRRMQGQQWYAYIYPKNIDVMSTAKILVPDIADRAQFALDEDGLYAFTSGYGITLVNETQMSPKYLLGLLNSKLLDFYLKRISTPMQNGFFRYFAQFIERLPIPEINFSNPSDVKRHNHMVALVERMLSSHQQLASTKTPIEKTLLQRQIASTDAQIDALVYELYGLTDEEIRLVEGR